MGPSWGLPGRSWTLLGGVLGASRGSREAHFLEKHNGFDNSPKHDQMLHVRSIGMTIMKKC